MGDGSADGARPVVPAAAALPDGHVLTVSGKNETNGDLNPLFEVYDPVHAQWLQHNPPQSPDFMGLPFYAHLFLMADGRVFFSGGRMDDARFQRAGIMAFAADHIDFQVVPAIVDSALRNQSSSVLLPPAQDQRVMIIGGGPADDRTSATGITEIVQLDQPNPAYQLAMPLSLPRIHLNAVLLPDRTVFVSGGAIIHEETGVPPIARLAVGDLRPSSGHMAARSRGQRHPHVPLGRSAHARWPRRHCERQPAALRTAGPLAAATAERGAADRDVLTAVPVWRRAATIGQVAAEWHYGQAIDIASPQAAKILWAELIRSGVTTHAFDNSQRLVDLPIAARAPGSLTVNAPAAPAIAPPGWYMLFLVDQNHIPSTATWIHLS